DLKARDMVLCRFPEVDMVVGKAGRAETPTDPAPMDMIETMVNFRPRELWPRRKLHRPDAERQTLAALDALARQGLVRGPADARARSVLVAATVDATMPLLDAAIREFAYQRNREFERELGTPVTDPDDPGYEAQQARWRGHVDRLNGELVQRTAAT